LIIGDKKGPFTFDLPGTELVTLERQLATSFSLARLLSTGHYARKNVGYLLAFERKAACIYETDDDNAPLPNWRWRERQTRARSIRGAGWVNVFRLFSHENIWPRGFPLELSQQPPPQFSSEPELVDSPMQQGLANGSPDVDAVWRLVLDKEITFRNDASVYLPRGAWCPFNTQSTWWWPPAYPLMYLPSHCSFRMTDIWRSFVAQRCLWELNTGVVFHAAEVVQARNQHSLIKDFEDEISGYLKNNRIKQVLEDLPLESGAQQAGPNLLKCYEALAAEGIMPTAELPLVRAWLADYERLTRSV